MMQHIIFGVMPRLGRLILVITHRIILLSQATLTVEVSGAVVIYNVENLLLNSRLRKSVL